MMNCRAIIIICIHVCIGGGSLICNQNNAIMTIPLLQWCICHGVTVSIMVWL